jgi:hypothetical protein
MRSGATSEPEKLEELTRGLGLQATPPAIALLPVPGRDSTQVRGVGGLVALMLQVERFRVLLAVQRMGAFGRLDEAQAPERASRGELRIERKDSATERATLVHGATIVGPEVNASALAVPQDQQPRTLPQKDEPAPIVEVDPVLADPLDEPPPIFAPAGPQAAQVVVGQRQKWVAATVSASCAAEFEKLSSVRQGARIAEDRHGLHRALSIRFGTGANRDRSAAGGGRGRNYRVS